MTSTRTTLLLACVLALTVSMPGLSASSRDVKKQFAEAARSIDQLERSGTAKRRDRREHTEVDDLRQWGFPPSLEGRIDSLLDAGQIVEAQSELDTAIRRSQQITQYWDHTLAIFWRERWQFFTEANGVAGNEPGAALLASDETMRIALESGDFAVATVAAKDIESQLDAAIRKTSTEIARAKEQGQVDYLPRRLPCIQPKQRNEANSVKITHSPSPMDFYPAGSVRREEEGAIVVRARVKPDNCAQIAILVSSGFPDLDQAAVNVAEASVFIAPIEDGKPAEGYLTFRVAFRLRN
jgi:TonB family protein